MSVITEFDVMQLADLAARNPLYRNAYENAVMQMQTQTQTQTLTQTEQVVLATTVPLFESVEEALEKFKEEDDMVQQLVSKDLRLKLWIKGVREGLDIDAAADRSLVAIHDPAFEGLLRDTTILAQRMRDNMPLSPETICEWVSDWCNQAEMFPRDWIMCLTCRSSCRKGFIMCDQCIMHCVPMPSTSTV